MSIVHGCHRVILGVSQPPCSWVLAPQYTPSPQQTLLTRQNSFISNSSTRHIITPLPRANLKNAPYRLLKFQLPAPHYQAITMRSNSKRQLHRRFAVAKVGLCFPATQNKLPTQTTTNSKMTQSINSNKWFPRPILSRPVLRSP